MSDSGFDRSIAIVIGIDAYSKGIPRLSNAVRDATEVARVLAEHHGYSVDLRLDGQVTHAALSRLLAEELPARVAASDRLLFYFAGHGIAHSDDEVPMGLLVPQDATLDGSTGLLPMSVLHEALARLPCRHMLAVLDCCFAGSFRWSAARDLAVSPSVLHRERYERFLRYRAWQALTSAAHDERALDGVFGDRGEANHSPFTAALLDGIAGAADTSPTDGVVTATELYLYVRSRVEGASSQRSRGQTPGLWPLPKHDRGEYVFRVPQRQLDLPPAPPLALEANPYRGLSPFEERHQALFFGREELTTKLAERVRRSTLTVVLGPSGAGKSSLAQAGLLPVLRSQGSTVVGSIRPGAAPRRALVAAGAAVLGEAAPPSSVTVAPQGTLRAATATWLETNPDGTLVLLVDQLEELVTLCRSDADRAAFLQDIATTAALDPERVRIVMTLRSDFEPYFLDGEAFAPAAWAAARFIVPPMTQDELRDAIEQPAKARVLWFEPPELTDRLVNEVIQMPGALPLLAFTLSELYRRCIERDDGGRALREADYDALGGVLGSVTNRASAVFSQLVAEDPRHEAVVRRLMLRLVSAGGDTARRRVPLSYAMRGDASEDERLQLVIDRFVEARLLVVGSDDGRKYVEPAHDALIVGWDQLRKWHNAAQESLALMHAMEPAVASWDDNRRRKRFLWLDDPRLPLLARARKEKAPWVNAAEDAFIRRSIARGRWRMVRRILVTVLIVVLPVPLMAGLIVLSCRSGWQEEQIKASEEAARHQAGLALARRIDAVAPRLYATAPDAALLLAATAYLRSGRPESVATLEASIRNTGDVLGVLGTAGHYQPSHIAASRGASSIAFAMAGEVYWWDRKSTTASQLGLAFDGHQGGLAVSPDGRRIAVTSAGGILVHDRERASTITIPAATPPIAFAPDGRLLAARRDENVLVISADGGGHAILLDAPATAMAFSPRSDMLASAVGAEVVIHDLGTRRRIGKRSPDVGDVSEVAFTNDAKMVIAAGPDGTTAVEVRRDSSSTVGPRGGVPVSMRVADNGTVFVYRAEVGRRTLRAWVPSGAVSETADAEGTGPFALSADGAFLIRVEKDRMIVRTTQPAWVAALGSQPAKGAAAGFAEERRIWLWDVATGAAAVPALPAAHLGGVADLEFGTDASLASASHDGTARLWDIPGGTSTLVARSLTGASIVALAWNSDQRLLAAADAAGFVEVRSADDRTAPTRRVSIGAPIVGLERALGSERGFLVATTRRGFLFDSQRLDRLPADLSELEVVGPITTPFARLGPDAIVAPQAPEPDRHRTMLRVLRGGRDEVHAGIDVGYNSLRALAVAADGKTLAAVSDDGVRLFDTGAWTPREVFRGFPGSPTSAALDSHGRLLAIGYPDGTVGVLSTATMQPVHTLHVQNQVPVGALAFSPNDKLLAAGEAAATGSSPDDLVRRACKLAGRNLTGAEWREYIEGRSTAFIIFSTATEPQRYCQACPEFPQPPDVNAADSDGPCRSAAAVDAGPSSTAP